MKNIAVLTNDKLKKEESVLLNHGELPLVTYQLQCE